MKKGFTLIELLAVIVILAIIAVIAAPIVLNVIEDARKSTLLNSADGYLKAVELAIANKNLEMEEGFDPKECAIQNDGNLICDEEVFVEVKISKGKKPKGGAIVLTQGKVTALELIYDDDLIITKVTDGTDGTDETDGELVFSTGPLKYTGENVVYFDVEKGQKCTISEYNRANSNTGYNGIDNRIDGQNSCLKFYVIDQGIDYVDLILDHNTTAIVPWNSSGTYDGGSKEVFTQLQTDTKDWVGTLAPQNYTQTKDSVTLNVDYTGYNARLITAEEIAIIVGKYNWTWSVYRLDSLREKFSPTCKLGNTTGCKYSWLYDRTSPTCRNYGCLNNSDVETSGYWTASANLEGSAAHTSCNGIVSYGISHKTRIGHACVNNEDHYGVRPVITVSREKVYDKPFKLCMAVNKDTVTTGNIPKGQFKAGDEYICKVNSVDSYHFFVVESNANKVSLILDRNINDEGKPANAFCRANDDCDMDGVVYVGATSSWISKSDFGAEPKHTKGPITVLNYLSRVTQDWVKIPQLTGTYIDENIQYGEGASVGYGTIDLSTFETKARLPKYSEVFGEDKCVYGTKNSCPLWLVNYQKKSTYYSKYDGYKNIAINSYSNVKGYWLMPSVKTANQVGVLSKEGEFTSAGVKEWWLAAVRPVIEIPKENIF